MRRDKQNRIEIHLVIHVDVQWCTCSWLQRRTDRQERRQRLRGNCWWDSSFFSRFQLRRRNDVSALITTPTTNRSASPRHRLVSHCPRRKFCRGYRHVVFPPSGAILSVVSSFTRGYRKEIACTTHNLCWCRFWSKANHYYETICGTSWLVGSKHRNQIVLYLKAMNYSNCKIYHINMYYYIKVW